MYENSGVAIRMQVQEHLITAHMGPGTTMKAHIEEFYRISSRVRSIGYRVEKRVCTGFVEKLAE